MNNQASHHILKMIYTRNSLFWEIQKKKNSLVLFKIAAREVPAYKNFLNKHKVNVKDVKVWKHFQNVPITSKKNYLRRYSLEDLVWNGNLSQPIIYSSTSGSTGKPFYFPRDEQLDWQYSVLIEDFLNTASERKKLKTLVIIAFGMGVWIGGIITYRAFEIASRRGYPVSIITPGINKTEIFNALRGLSKNYEQTILVGYPPFVKDIIDEASSEGINIKKINVKLLFAAEAFTEEFRDYIAGALNIRNIYKDTLNIYGTADLGAMAFESPTCILFRRLITKNSSFMKDVLGSVERTPTLTQYNPCFVGFEAVNEEILLTGNSIVPLIRYSVGDHGGVYSFSELAKKMNDAGIDYESHAKKNNIQLYELPFVYVYERTDLSVSLYGLQVYPETIKEVLLRKEFQILLTGKFTLITKYDYKQNQHLEINLELKRGQTKSKKIESKLLRDIVHALREKNSEFRELSDFLGNRAHPKLVFWPLGDALHFQHGIKQKWVKKS